jgi:hypothetical protein
MFVAVGYALLALITLPVLTLLVFAVASHAASPRRRVVLTLVGMVVVAASEGNQAFGLIMLLANAILARNDMRRTWQSMHARWPRSTIQFGALARLVLRLGRRWFRWLSARVWGIRCMRDIKSRLAAQSLRLAIALTPHRWTRDVPARRGIIGIPVPLADARKAWPSLDEATRALQQMNLIMERHSGVRSCETVPNSMAAKRG